MCEKSNLRGSTHLGSPRRLVDLHLMVVEAMLMLLTSGKDDHAEQADVCEPQLHAWCVFVCCIFDILSTSEKERIYNIIVRIYAS